MTDRARKWLLRSRPFLVYPAVIMVMVVLVADRRQIEWAVGLTLFCGGLTVWTLIEWCLHRAMHVDTGRPAVARFQELAHLCHHRAPHDLEHSVVSLRASVPLGMLFLALWLAMFRDVDRAMLLHVGVLTGYLGYEFIHLADHGAWRIPVLRRLARYHARHHHQDWNRTFGVTSPLWDWVFRSLPQPRDSNARTHSTRSGSS